MKSISIIFVFLFQFLSVSAQYITNRGLFLEGTSYISTSRIEAFRTRDKFANFATISMDFVHMSGAGHSLNKGDYYTIQTNFFERNIGQTILLKCKNGKVIELSTKSLQRDPFVQIYWLPESKVREIVNGEIIKIRIRVQNGYVDRFIKGNSFSKAVGRCYKLLNEAKKEVPSTDNFRKDF
ncbi:MAG: hypothetical protein J6I79_03605 [Paludibacteraceae bacterium]|nr:hypothetical protein [Paludibacteraceae bacterium]